VQKIAAKNEVAGSLGGGIFGYLTLNDLATFADQIGSIAGGTLAVLLLCNWIWVHVIRRKKTE